MNNYEEIYTLIESINNKVKRVEEILNQIEELRILLSTSEKYTITIDTQYKEIKKQLTEYISRFNQLNSIITNELLVEYEHIFKELNSKCSDVISEFTNSVYKLNPPISSEE